MRKEKTMTYEELKKLCAGKHLPITAKNEDGENIIIEQGVQTWSTEYETWDRNFFKIVTAQRNGWTRINLIFEDGASDELYQK